MPLFAPAHYTTAPPADPPPAPSKPPHLLGRDSSMDPTTLSNPFQYLSDMPNAAHTPTPQGQPSLVPYQPTPPAPPFSASGLASNNLFFPQNVQCFLPPQPSPPPLQLVPAHLLTSPPSIPLPTSPLTTLR
ncbi:hypothetical protein B9479_007868, partial [Cryptococcus floricola]